MIHVYYFFTTNLSELDLNYIIPHLSSYAKNKFEGFRRAENRSTLLASQALLSKILLEKKDIHFTIDKLQIESTGRPFFENAPFDFNISHTDGCVAIVYSEDCKVGIDIESIKTLDFSDFSQLFSPREWTKINSAENKYKQFYEYWTQLESALKADGRGLSILSDSTIKLNSGYVIIDNQKWLTTHKIFEQHISCCIASNKSSKIEFTQLTQLISKLP